MEVTASIAITTLGVRMTRSTPREVTETMARLAQCLGKEGLATDLLQKSRTKSW